MLTGSNRGRSVRLWGVTISRLRDGRIVEDYSAFDSLELLKQLGLWRTLLAAPSLLRALRDGRPGWPHARRCPRRTMPYAIRVTHGYVVIVGGRRGQ